MFIVATTMATTAATLISLSIMDRDPVPAAAPTNTAANDQGCACETPTAERAVVEQPTPPPSVQTAKMADMTVVADAAPDYDKIVRRIVRAHINEVRYCYNQGLTRDPDLEGKVTVEFTIGLDGNVSEADAVATALDDAAVVTCVTKAVKRWKFPRPSSDEPLTVTYPFALSPG